MKKSVSLCRNSFLCFMMFVHFNSINAQTSSKTELLVVGTVHRGNSNITRDTLLNVLTTYKPDVILWENNNDFILIPGLSLINKLNIVRVSNEMLAIQKFQRSHKRVPILVIDGIVTKRRAFIKKILKTEKQFFEALYKIKMTKEDSLEYLTYRILKNEYLSLCETNTLEQINRDSFYQQYETIDSLNYQMITLAKQYLVDKKIVDNFKELTDFGYLRNNYMAQKIKGILKAHGNKRIFVIVGNAHKYYLVNHLKKEDELEITWDSLSNF